MLDGAGNGFFKDSATFATGIGPIRAFVGHFERRARPGPGRGQLGFQHIDDLPELPRPRSAAVTIPTGGLDPIAAIAGDFNGDGYEDLVVANSGDSLITLLDGGPAGLTLAGSVALGSSGRPTSLAVSGQSSGDYHFYVSTEGSNAILSVSFSLAPGEPMNPGGETQPHLGESFSNEVQGAVSSLGLLSGASTPASSNNASSASTAQSQANGTSIGLAGSIGSLIATMAGPLQELTSMAMASLTPLVSNLLIVDQGQVSDVLPLGDGPMAAVAVLLTSASESENSLTDDLGNVQDDNGTNPSAPMVESVPGPERDDDLPAPLLDRFVSGVETQLMRASRRLDEAQSSSDPAEPFETRVPFLEESRSDSDPGFAGR